MASKLTAVDVPEITRQSDVTSKPIRDGRTNLKNKVNEVIDDLAAVSIGTTNAETTAARPYHTSLKERLDSIWDGKQNYIKNGGEVTEQGTPDMTVAVAAGEAKINGIDCKWAGVSSGTVTAPGSNTRLDIVVANSDSTLSIVTGSAAASPVFPSVVSTQVVLAVLVVKNTTTSLNEGTEIFTVKNFENPFFPNLYINTAYTATNKKHNNVIVDLSGAVITGTLECQGNCWIIDYTNNAANATGEFTDTTNLSNGYTNSSNWTIQNRDNQPGGVRAILNGSGGGSITGIQNDLEVGNNAVDAVDLAVKAFNVYVYNISLLGGNGANGVTDQDTGFGSPGDLHVGASGGAGSDGGDVTFTAINEIEILSGGAVNLSGKDGGTGLSTSTGTVGNLGGSGGNAGSGGTLTYTTKTFTNNGTLTQSAGTPGSAGVGSGGSDNNGNGIAGSSGSDGSTSATLYDFTDGLPDGYGDWIHPLYTGYALTI